MKRNILISLMVIALSLTMVVGATTAYFSDTETSNENTLVAGTLDLTIFGQDSNAITFDVEDIAPGYRETAHLTFRNEGSIDGILNISKIEVRDYENDLIEPENEAGDTTPNDGELSSVLFFHLFFDDGDGIWEPGVDQMFLDRRMSELPDNWTMDLPIAAHSGAELIGEIISWPSSPNDNKAQSDSVQFDLEFTLSQDIG